MFVCRKNIAGDSNEAQIAQQQAGFFEHLAPSRLLRRFTQLDTASRELPFETLGGCNAATKQDLASMGYNHPYSTVHPLFTSTNISSPGATPYLRTLWYIAGLPSINH